METEWLWPYTLEKLLAEIIIEKKANPDLRNEVQNLYSHYWTQWFSNRLRWGRKFTATIWKSYPQ